MKKTISEVIAIIFLFPVCVTEKRHPFGSDFDSSYVSINLLTIPDIGTGVEYFSSHSCKIRPNIINLKFLVIVS